MKKLILFLFFTLISFNLYAHCCPGYCCNEKVVIGNPNDAINKYCPGFCCPDIGDSNKLLLGEIMQYCTDHPKAKKLNPELQALLDIEIKVRTQHLKNFPDVPFDER
jgi:hypothetical protein